MSSENVIYHGPSLEVRDENPQIWISMNTCPLTLNEISLDIYVTRYLKEILGFSEFAPTAPNAVVGPTNTYLLSKLNTDTFRLLRLRDVTDTSYR